MKRTTLCGLVVLVGLFVGCKHPGLTKSPIHPVAIARAAVPVPAEAAMRYTATILPNQEIDLSFKTGGYVAWIAQRSSAAGGYRALDAGDLVRAGELLARLHVPELRSQVAQAAASVAGAVAARTSSEAQLEQARADAERAESDWTRAQRLYEQSALTKPDYEAAKNKYLLATEQVRQASAGISLQATQMKTSEARRIEADSLLVETELRAPFTGVVLGRDINAGSLVPSGGAAITLAEIDKVKVSFSVPDTKIRNLHLGDRLSLICEAVSSKPITGTVTVVAAVADRQSSTFRVDVTLPNADRRLRPGMITSVVIASDSKPIGAIASVPMSALIHRPSMGDGYGVFVIANEQGKSIARLRSIQPGQIEGDDIAILNGLEAGANVVVRGNTDLQDGDTVVEATQGDRP